jgi:hypothetical protein
MTHIDTACTGQFKHPNNLSSGHGRVIYGANTVTSSGACLPSGWVLPGGRRVLHEHEAREAAERIDAFLRSRGVSA